MAKQFPRAIVSPMTCQRHRLQMVRPHSGEWLFVSSTYSLVLRWRYVTRPYNIYDRSYHDYTEPFAKTS